MSTPEPRRITPTDVAHHLACQHRTQLERQRRAGELHVAFAPDARLEGMIQRGQEHERAYVARLRAAGRQLVDLTDAREPAAALAAMRTGADVIVQAPLGDGAFFGIVDVLIRVDTPSALGPHSYEPVDTKLAAETKAGALLQLLTYCEVLGSMQGTVPAQFRVVTPSAEETYRTADHAAYFRVIRDHLRGATVTTPPPATYPEPVLHCDVCAYWQHCDKRRRTDDHPSLIAGSSRTQVRELQRQNLPTLAAFAQAGRLPAEPERGRRESYERLAHQAQLQLQARTTSTIPVDRLPVEPGRGLCRLPAPSDGDVFLDFEGDPFVGFGGLEYLTGYGIFDGNAFRYTQLWSLDREGEKRALVTFLNFVRKRLAEHPELHVYHYGAYEVAALRRLCSRHDTHSDVLDVLLRGERFLDLHRVVKESLRIGVESYGLKDLEKVIGFERQLDLRTAGEARRDLELSLELRTGAITEKLKAKVAAYNQDDCLATVALRDWIERQRAAAIASGLEIPRPTLRAGDANETVREREARVNALREALLRDMPQAEARNDEQRARALLADLVGYFRREAKSAWWEHFRLRELPADERLDEREVIAELRFAGIEPKQGKERTVRCAYEFPPQEVALDVGKKVYVLRDEDPKDEGIGTELGTVVAIDHDARRVVIKHRQDASDLRPTAVFREQVVANTPLEDALLAFAEHVRDRGLPTEGPYARAADMLLRRPPRPEGGAAGAGLRRADEGFLAAALRVCRGLGGAVLPVQGPPGTGKSYTGGRTIAALAATQRVGITAVSHKVIDNLLRSAQEGARESGRTLRLVHKDDDEDGDGIEYTTDNQEALDAIGPGCVVGGTAWLWALPDAEARLDYLFVDEAGQMSLAQLLAIARCAKNLVLLGDPQQLEQPQQGAHPDGADVAALTHVIGVDRHTLRDDQGLFLSETWRLHPSLCAFTSELYYDGRLTPRSGNELQRIGGTGVIDGAGHFLLECAHEANQASSPEEVGAIEGLLRRILGSGATWTNRAGLTASLRPDDVLVIAPYNAQVGALRRALTPLGVTHIGTVDKFQGQEAPIVVYSCTSSSPQDAPRGLGFLYDPHRLNVATSRARCAFVMVASPALFEPEVRTPEQMRWANGMCRFREVAQPL
ncbi:MAG: TM0106 family RecB-like putative nuclease [Planctomycetes bacterium]|nr:TM0106 family RecB-like putative nuclease [Planctomycetota bacterium]